MFADTYTFCSGGRQFTDTFSVNVSSFNNPGSITTTFATNWFYEWKF